MSIGLRRYWLIVHRWLGLTVGLVFVLIGLTGSLLVFDHAIDEWLNPQLLLSQGTGHPAALEDVIEAAEQTYGGPSLSASKPRVENGVWTVWFASGSEAEPRFTAVYVDPYTAQVTGQRVWGEDLMSWIYRLHFRLLAGKPGAMLVGGIGIVVMLSIASGIYLWWPLWKNSWRAAFAIRPRSRFNYDLHKTVGIVSSGFLLVLAFTGVTMEFPEWFRGTVKIFADVTEAPEDLTSTLPVDPQALTADEAVEIARQHFPEGVFDHLHPPTGEDGFYEVAFRQQGEVQTSFGRSQVFLDQYSGEALALRRPEDFTAADAFFAWQFPLHNGEAFGMFGRWLVLCMGIMPAVLYTTGVLLWIRRRASKRRSKVEEASAREGGAQASVARNASAPLAPSEIPVTTETVSSGASTVADASTT